jgi:c-di-GMP-binding flagellar brake protein YcgR
MQKDLTGNLQVVCRAVLNALVDVVPGEILACDLVQIDHREFRFQSVAAAHFPGGPIRRLLLGCEERLAAHFAETLHPVSQDAGPGTISAGLAAFCQVVRNSLLMSGLPWASDQEFLVHDSNQFRVQCDGVRNFLFRVAVAEGRLDLVIDLAPKLLSCDWLVEKIADGQQLLIKSNEESISDPAIIGRVMNHLAHSGADVQIKILGDDNRLELLQATFLASPDQSENQRFMLTCARRTSLESADDIPEKVTIVFILQDKLLQCSCQVVDHSKVWLDDDISLPTLELKFPSSVTYGQRRGAFRLEPPERLHGTVQRLGENTLTFKPVSMRVLDLSFTGARFLLASNTMISGFKGGSLVHCVLDMPEGFGQVGVQAVIRRLNLFQDDPDRKGAALGIEFTDPQDSASLLTIRRYIKDRHAARLSRGSVKLKIG